MTLLGHFVRTQWDSRRLSAGLILVLGSFGTAVYAWQVHDAYPVKDWLFWTIAQLWLWLALFSLACASFGQLILVRGLRMSQLPALESAVLSMAVGTVAFVILMYLAGAVGAYDARFAVALPLVMLAMGAFDGSALFLRIASEQGNQRTNLLVTAVGAVGLIGVVVAYLGILSPDTIGCDAMMAHMKIPEEYARAGRIVAFPSNYQIVVPHLASILYTWAYLVPGLQKVHHWMLALHLEFSFFLWTLVGVAAAVRRMVGDRRLRVAWVAIFLFPGFYVADSNMAGCADHVLAFFSVPIAVAALHVCTEFSKRSCVLLGIVLAGALLTKYQAVYLLFAVGTVVGWVWLRVWFQRSRHKTLVDAHPSGRELAFAPLIVLAVTALIFSPHIIKNLVFYHNPVYPFLHTTFTAGTPQFPGAAIYVDNLFQDIHFVPQGTLGQRLMHAVRLFFTFSFEPHYSSRTSPYFGSLYTLLLPMLFVGKLRREDLRVAGIGALALITWGLVFNVDRNIQTFMPVLACVTASLIVKAWRLGWVSRFGIAPLVLFQVVWAGDTAFDGAGRGRISSAFDLVASGLEGRAAKRFDGYRASYLALTEKLPTDARVLLHLAHDSLGIDRELWLDRPGFQGLITYQNLRTPRELYDYYRGLGITHLIQDSREPNAAAQRDELLFRMLAHRHSTNLGVFGAYTLMRLPEQPPPAEAAYRVLSLGISGYQNGVYPVENMGTVEYLDPPLRKYSPPARPVDAAGLVVALSEVDAVLVRRGGATSPEFPQTLAASGFEIFTTWSGSYDVYLKRRR